MCWVFSTCLPDLSPFPLFRTPMRLTFVELTQAPRPLAFCRVWLTGGRRGRGDVYYPCSLPAGRQLVKARAPSQPSLRPPPPRSCRPGYSNSSLPLLALGHLTTRWRFSQLCPCLCPPSLHSAVFSETPCYAIQVHAALDLCQMVVHLDFQPQGEGSGI